MKHRVHPCSGDIKIYNIEDLSQKLVGSLQNGHSLIDAVLVQ